MGSPAQVLSQWKPAHNPWAVAMTVTLATFMEVLDTSIANVALPHIAGSLGASQEEATWVLTSYLVASAIILPISGWLSNRMGRKRFYMTCVALFTICSMLCGIAPTLPFLIVARILQGLGGGGLMTLSQALVGEAIPPRERARYQGYLAAIAVCANSFGPVAGGYLTEHFGWRSIFLINVPIGLIAVALTWRLPGRAAERVEWRPDPAGLILFTVFVTTTLLALEQAQHVKLSALPLAAGLFTAGVVALVLLVRQENRAPSPLIPMSLLRRPAIWHRPFANRAARRSWLFAPGLPKTASSRPASSGRRLRSSSYSTRHRWRGRS